MKTENEKTVRVRVAVVVMADGDWAASGWNPDCDDLDTRSESEVEMVDQAEDLLSRRSEGRLTWIEATLPLPAASTVEAEVVGEVRDAE